MRKIIVLTMTIMLLGSSVAYAKKAITTMRDPDAPDVAYKKIIVNMHTPAYQFKKDVEKRFKKYITVNSSTDVVEANAIFFPTRSYSEKKVREVVDRSGADAVLSITPAKIELSRTKLKTDDETEEEVVDATEKEYPQLTWETSVSTAGCLLDASLYDVKREKSVWYASVNTCMLGMGKLDKSLSKKLSKELWKSGFLESGRKSFSIYSRTSLRNK